MHKVEIAVPAAFKTIFSKFSYKNNIPALAIYLLALPLDVTLISFSSEGNSS